MSNVLGALWSLIKKILGKIFAWLKKFLGDFFWIILIIVAIYFAPMIVAWLGSVGAPSFLITAFEGLATLTPYVTTAVQWVWSGVEALGSTAWQAYSGLSAGTQAAIAVGAAALIAPEETATLVGEVVDLAGDVLTTGVTTIGGALVSNPVVLIAAGLAVWWFLSGSSDSKKEQQSDSQPFEGQTNGTT